MALSASDILKAEDIEIASVDVPEWKNSNGDSTVHIKALTGLERDDYECSVFMTDDKAKSPAERRKNFRAQLLVRAIVSADGVPMFTVKDIDALGRKSGKALDRCYEVATRLSGMSKSDQQEILKNSNADQSGDSSTA